jgi:hypothetical protein
MVGFEAKVKDSEAVGVALLAFFGFFNFMNTMQLRVALNTHLS